MQQLRDQRLQRQKLHEKTPVRKSVFGPRWPVVACNCRVVFSSERMRPFRSST